MSGNESYEEDILYVTRHNRWVLSSIGVWPMTSKGSNQFLPRIALGFNNLVLSFTVLQCALHVALEQKDPLLRLKFLGLTCFSFISLMKYWVLIVRRLTIRRCIEQVQADWKQVELKRDRELMLNYGKTGRNLTMLSAVFMYASGIIYHTIQQYAIGSFVDERNRTIKLLIYPTYSGFYDVQRSPVYELVYVLQCFCGYVFDTATVSVCGLTALFATHACGQIDVVVSRLDELVLGQLTKKESELSVKLIEIVEHHIRILRFSATVETVLREVCLFEFVGSILIICLLEFYCITDWEQNNKIGVLTYTLLLVSLTFNIFLLCYIGDILIEKSTNLGVSCCMIDWYRLPCKTIQGLILIIAMSNTPAKISAGSIIDLSLPTFGNILKTSFAYLNFLRTAVV